MLKHVLCSFLFMLFFSASYSGQAKASTLVSVSDTQQLNNQVLSLKVMMAKFRNQIYSLGDIQALEKKGLLTHQDAKLMYNVLFAKFSQTKNDILSLITRL